MKKPMVKTYCDFCEKEIEESTPKVSGHIQLADSKGADQIIAVEIRLSSTEPRKRFGHDICERCVFETVARLAPQGAEAATV
jgi:hypothetical protein